MIKEFEYSSLQHLPRRRADDPTVVDLINRDPGLIERSAHLGYVEFKDAGLSVMFKKAAEAAPPGEATNPGALLVSAFHFHRGNHEGYSEYLSPLPGGVTFGDSQAEVLGKLGEPSATGGGGMGSVLKGPTPRWLRYAVGSATLQFQLDPKGRVEMATLYAPDIP